MYNFLLSLLKKKNKEFYKILKYFKHIILFKKNFIKRNYSEIEKIIINIENESYSEFKKKNFLKNLNKKSTLGVLEINNSCNINCVMCDTKSSSRQKKLMDLNLCEKSVKEMKLGGINSVLLHTIGDPLANVKLKDYLKILRNYNIQAGISTNGLMLDKHLETLLEYFDICSNIRFSIDGVKKETYEKIRFGGNFNKLLENLELAVKKLKPCGYEILIDCVVTKDNFDELGDFIVFFKKYINYPYKNMHFNFMNSLSPSNNYFLKNNVIEERTSKNFYCNFASKLTPYVLVDGRVSACCRDYDGSLVVDNIHNTKISEMSKNQGFKRLQNTHLNEVDNINSYDLCKSCYEVDTRFALLWSKTISMMLFKHPNNNAKFYQEILNKLLFILKNFEKNNFKKFLNKYSLI